MFIEIVKSSETIPWQFTDPDTKVKTDSVFHLRVVPDSVQKVWRKELTKVERSRHGTRDILDTETFVDRCLCYAIVSWDHVQHKGQDLPCTDEYKVMLPDIIGAYIIRLCVGKELGEVRAGNIGGGTPLLGQVQNPDDQEGSDPN